MTSYKKLWEEADEKLTVAMTQVEDLKKDLLRAQTVVLNDFMETLENEDAKDILRLFANRVENRGELVLLMRVLSRIGDSHG